MTQKYDIILWKKPEMDSKTFGEIVQDTYELLQIFKSFPMLIQPRYYVDESKRQIAEFNYTFDELKQLLINNTNREGDKAFEELGYTLSFFSSMEGKASTKSSFHVGGKHKTVVNTIVISFPASFDLQEGRNADVVRRVFRELVETFKPFWGCVSDRIQSRKYMTYFSDGKPSTVYWLNYFSKEVVNNIGESKIKSVVDKNEGVSFANGIFSLGEKPIDVDNPDEVFFYEKIHSELFS